MASPPRTQVSMISSSVISSSITGVLHQEYEGPRMGLHEGFPMVVRYQRLFLVKFQEVWVAPILEVALRSWSQGSPQELEKLLSIVIISVAVPRPIRSSDMYAIPRFWWTLPFDLDNTKFYYYVRTVLVARFTGEVVVHYWMLCAWCQGMFLVFKGGIGMMSQTGLIREARLVLIGVNKCQECCTCTSKYGNGYVTSSTSSICGFYLGYASKICIQGFQGPAMKEKMLVYLAASVEQSGGEEESDKEAIHQFLFKIETRRAAREKAAKDVPETHSKPKTPIPKPPVPPPPSLPSLPIPRPGPVHIPKPIIGKLPLNYVPPQERTVGVPPKDNSHNFCYHIPIETEAAVGKVIQAGLLSLVAIQQEDLSEIVPEY
ncbi:hypothetical protein BT96DRAFT_947763 [Gymnopus androsaceus JB14]|uniref:Uncharacterized protein n=1 Tax=Gymnopus androsaceus JB14 TaxID=1447944 RepID=A0A6A4GS19_9AGAR|nr:hypothetical protein BT96DRAFT_947763 [Gymnopus androsaceus JB14]